MQTNPRLLRGVVEEYSQSGDVGNRQKEVDVSEMLILFHEKVGPVAQEEITHDETQFRHREEKGVARICQEKKIWVSYFSIFFSYFSILRGSVVLTVIIDKESFFRFVHESL